MAEGKGGYTPHLLTTVAGCPEALEVRRGRTRERTYMGLIDRIFGKRRLRSLVERVALMRGEALLPELERAVIETARILKPGAVGRRLRPFYPQLVLFFARQRADGQARLASSHWISGGGRNVGMDVLEAQAVAQNLLVRVLARRPPFRRPLSEMVEALDALIDARRNADGDPDGYGLGTLHEIQRDIAELALAESVARSADQVGG